MRVVFSTPPLPADKTQPPDDATIPGTAYFESVLYDAGESAPNLTRVQPVSAWRAAIGSDAALVAPAGRLMGVTAAVIPATFAALPRDALLEVRWHWRIGDRR